MRLLRAALQTSLSPRPNSTVELFSFVVKPLSTASQLPCSSKLRDDDSKQLQSHTLHSRIIQSHCRGLTLLSTWLCLLSCSLSRCKSSSTITCRSPTPRHLRLPPQGQFLRRGFTGRSCRDRTSPRAPRWEQPMAGPCCGWRCSAAAPCRASRDSPSRGCGKG